MEYAKDKLLHQLSPNTREFRYSGKEQMEHIISQEYGPFLDGYTQSPHIVFTNISRSEFTECENYIKTKKDYIAPLQLAIITMSTPAHDIAAQGFNEIFMEKATAMSVKRQILARGPPISKAANRRKQPDFGWSPRSPRYRPSQKWPTVALEVGWSETRGKLESDMAFWLNDSNGQVEMGICIDIKPTTGNITISSWERSPAWSFNNRKPRPRKTKEIKITRQGRKYRGADLVVPFECLLLREPSEGERDFVFGKTDMMRIADDIWLMQDPQ